MFRALLVPLDGSALAEQALPAAASIAKAAGARMDLVRAHRSRNSSTETACLEAIAAELRSSPGVSVTCAAPEGDATQAIVQRAAAIGADLIVLTSHGQGGFGRLWLGSVADGVARASHIPVLITRPSASVPGRGEPAPFKRILIPLDGSDSSSEALLAAASIAACYDSRIDLLRVVRPMPGPYGTFHRYTSPSAVGGAVAEILEREASDDLELAARTLKAHGVRQVEAHVVVDPYPAVAIGRCASIQDADLIAMSTHGLGKSRHLLGSVANAVLRASGKPVLLHRPASVPAASISVADLEAQLPSLSAF